MKKIFAGIVLPTLAAAAVIGSGFSVWFFGENQDSVSSNANVTVENLLRIGDVAGDKELALLHLDQTKGVRDVILRSPEYVKSENNGNADGKSNYNETKFTAIDSSKTEAKGLYLTAKDATKDFSGNINYNEPGNGYQDYLKGTAKLQLVTEFKFENGIKDFVGMKTTGFNEATEGKMEKGADGVYTFTWATRLEEMANYSGHLPVGSDDNKPAGVINFAFEYLPYTNQFDSMTEGTKDAHRTSSGVMATVEPHNDAEYSHMLKEIGTNSKLTITTTATIVKVGA